MPDYAFKKKINLSYNDAIEKVTAALMGEGFGVLTEIDVKATLKKKLDVDFKRYKILGACNPPFAHQALQAEEDVGVLLPCNVCVYESAGDTILSMMKPSIAMGFIENPGLAQIAGEVEKKLQKVFDSIE